MKLCRKKLHFYTENKRKQCPVCHLDGRRRRYKENGANTRASIKKYKDKNREKVNSYGKLWQQANADKCCAATARRAAAKLQRTPKWLTPLQLNHIKLFYEASNALSVELGIELHVDHIIPMQGREVSGLHVPWNLQVLPKHENMTKSNKLVV